MTNYNHHIIKKFREITGNRDHKLSILYQWMKQGVVGSLSLFKELLESLDT